MNRKWMGLGLAALLGVLFLSPLKAVAEDAVLQIRVGNNYRQYNNDELRRRVWELERAVSQLQERVYDLEATPVAAPVVVAPPPERPWTCRVSAFGRTYVRTLPSRGEAEARVLQECSAASNAIHCDEIQCSQ